MNNMIYLFQISTTTSELSKNYGFVEFDEVKRLLTFTNNFNKHFNSVDGYDLSFLNWVENTTFTIPPQFYKMIVQEEYDVYAKYYMILVNSDDRIFFDLRWGTSENFLKL